MSENLDTNIAFSDLSRLTPADFEAQLNTNFAIDLNYLGLAPDGQVLRRDDLYPVGAKLDLELTEVAKHQPLSPHSRQEPFSLLFRGSHELPLFSDVHVLLHESLGKLAVFLSAVNVSPGIRPESFSDGRFYECVIN